MKHLMTRGAVVLTAIWLYGGIVGAADSWTYGASDSFEVYATGGAGTVRDALSLFERAHSFLSALLPDLPSEPQVRSRVVIFANDQQFAPYRTDPNARVFAAAGDDRNYLVLNRLDDASSRIMLQEYARLMRHQARYPAWLNDGLAEMLSTLQVAKGRISVADLPPEAVSSVRAPGATMLELNRLFAVAPDSPEYSSKAKGGIFYGQSTLLTHMLLVDERYRFNGPKFLRMLMDGMSSADALMAAYSKSVDVVTRDLTTYAARRQFQNLYDPPAPTNATLRTRSVPGVEADLLTATLLANTPGGDTAARAAFAKVEQQKPDDLLVIEARALFEMRRGTPESALPYFARALALETHNAALLRTYVSVDRANAPTILPKALELVPEDVGLRIEYAKLLLSERQGRPAIVALLRVNPTPEYEFDYYLQLANAYLLAEQPEKARETAGRAVQVAQPGAQAEAGAGFIKAMDDAEVARANAVSFSDDLSLETKPPAPTVSTDVAVLAGSTDASLRLERSSIVIADTVSATGRIRNIVCARGGADLTLEVLAEGKTLRLFVDNKNSIVVLGKPGETANLTCGAQDVAIKVSYKPNVDKARGTVGYVRVLDYRK